MKEYEVKFYTSSVYIPMQIFKHPWVTISHNGHTERYEILHYGKNHGNNTYLCTNPYEPHEGLHIWHNAPKKWKEKCIGTITGNNNSLAQKVYEFVKSKSPDYKYKNTYNFFPGPNSNSYVQWILDSFPEIKIQLPWSCIGKNYKK